MSDYIKREDAIEAVKEMSENYTGKGKRDYHPHIDFVVDELKYLPSADVVEGIKCSECEFLRIYNTKDLYARCTKWDINFFPFETDTRTHGCSWGERKDNE